MLIDIDRIKVGERIRKDFGDLQELADDIQANSLLNPIVVTPNSDGTYSLIAGERRLRAMRDILGYRQVTVNTVNATDAEHALMMEISENECRKEFTKTERLDYARRLARIESAKAKERMSDGGKGRQDIVNLRSADAVAAALNTNRETIRQEQFIADNRDMLDPADFADWDEGKLSTNKAYQRIRQAKEQAERSLADALAEVKALERQNDQLYEQATRRQEPQVIEREVYPEDYQRIKADSRRQAEDFQRLRKRNEELREELAQAKVLLGEKDRNDNATWDIEVLTTATNNYLRQYGGKAWAFDQFYRVDEVTQTEFVKAITNLAVFSQNLLQMINDNASEA